MAIEDYYLMTGLYIPNQGIIIVPNCRYDSLSIGAPVRGTN